MKIKINDNEKYEIVIPEEMDAGTLNGFIERLKIVRKLFEGSNLEVVGGSVNKKLINNTFYKKVWSKR